MNEMKGSTEVTNKIIMPLNIAGSLLAVMGCTVNLFSIRFLHVKEQRMGGTKILLTALSIFDTIALALPTLTVIIVRLIHGLDPWNSKEMYDADSIVFNYLLRLPKYCSNVTLLVLSVERLLCIVTPHKVKLLFTRKMCTVIVIAIAVVLAVILIPNTVQYESVVTKNNITGENDISLGPTHFARHYKDLYLVLNILIFTFVICCPLLGITFCNIAFVYLLLSKRKRILRHATRNDDRNVREIKTTKIVLSVSAICVLCVNPLGVYLLFRGMMEVKLSPVRYTHFWLAYSTLETINYAANGFVYLIGSAKFRSYLWNVFTGKCRCTRNRVNSTTRADIIDLEELQGPVAGTSAMTDSMGKMTAF